MSVSLDARRGLIALDFDGTLLASDESISDRTQRALTAADAAGWLVVGATGRPKALADAVSTRVPAMRLVVSNNGSLTIDTHTGEVLDEVTATADDTRWACHVAREAFPGIGFTIDQVSGDQVWEPGFDVLVPHAPLGASVADVTTEIRGPVRKLVAFSDAVGVHDMVNQLGPLLAPRLAVTYSGLSFVDIGPHGVSKASALENLVGRFGLRREQTWAFGDGRNDHDMLAWAGTGVAMANARDETCAIADTVTMSNDDEGIAMVIERLDGVAEKLGVQS